MRRIAPVDILNPVAAAMRTDRPVDIITADERDADAILSLLEQPYAAPTPNGVTVYTEPRRVEQPGGASPVHLRDTTATWQLTTDDQLQLAVNDSVVASGSVETAASQLDYGLPTYQVRNDQHCIVDPNGIPIVVATDLAELLDTWQPVRLPVVPQAQHYLADVTIRYRDGDDLLAVSNPPAWQQSTTNAYAQSQAAFERFYDLYLRAIPGATLRKDAVIDAFQAWYRQRLTAGGITPDRDTDRDAVSRPLIRKAISQFSELKRRQTDAGDRVFLADHAWAYRPPSDAVDDTTDASHDTDTGTGPRTA